MTAMGYLSRSQLTNVERSGQLIDISVTQAHIDKGLSCIYQYDGENTINDGECPVAWAIREYINDFQLHGAHIGVSHNAVVYIGGSPRCELSEEVSNWIAKFDKSDESGIVPSPFTFQIGERFLNLAKGTNG